MPLDWAAERRQLPRPKACGVLADHHRCRCRRPAQQPSSAVVQCSAIAQRGPWWLRVLRRQLPSCEWKSPHKAVRLPPWPWQPSLRTSER